MRSGPPEAFFPDPDRRPTQGTPYDPLRICIYTTIGLISWLITPALTVAVFGSAGVAFYVRARRNGLAKSRCALGDTRLVIAYLGAVATVGIVVTGYRLVRWIG